MSVRSRVGLRDSPEVHEVGQERPGLVSIVAQLQDGAVAWLSQGENRRRAVEYGPVGPPVEPRWGVVSGGDREGTSQVRNVRHPGPPRDQGGRSVPGSGCAGEGAVQVHDGKAPGAQGATYLPEYPQEPLGLGGTQSRRDVLVAARNPGIHELDLEGRGHSTRVQRLGPRLYPPGRRRQRRHHQDPYGVGRRTWRGRRRSVPVTLRTPGRGQRQEESQHDEEGAFIEHGMAEQAPEGDERQQGNSRSRAESNSSEAPNAADQYHEVRYGGTHSQVYPHRHVHVVAAGLAAPVEAWSVSQYRGLLDTAQAVQQITYPGVIGSHVHQRVDFEREESLDPIGALFGPGHSAPYRGRVFEAAGPENQMHPGLRDRVVEVAQGPDRDQGCGQHAEAHHPHQGKVDEAALEVWHRNHPRVAACQHEISQQASPGQDREGSQTRYEQQEQACERQPAVVEEWNC